jgi:hypothetical protein
VSLAKSSGAAVGEPSGLMSVIQNKQGQIFLTGPSCHELQEQDQVLRTWTALVKENSGPKASPVVAADDENRCELLISNSVPSFVRSLQNFKTAFSGPNCWNTNLRLSHLEEFSRFSKAAEMSFWMNSPYCREVSDSEKSFPGDIIAIRALNPNPVSSAALAFEEIHGMIYISEDLVFSKNTSSRMSSYGIQRASLVYQNFRTTDPGCMKIQGQPAGCPVWTNHFRCTSSQRDRVTLENSNVDFARLSAQVRGIESVLSDYVMYGRGDYPNKKENINFQLLELEKKVSATKSRASDLDFFLKALLMEIKSLQGQAEILNKLNL